MASQSIKITGARQHNLKNLTLEIPREKLVVITGLSGSGKSSLAFDTLYAEGQRRYVESLSAYARQFLDQMQKPDVDFIEGLSPAIAIEQREVPPANPRSTIATTTEDFGRITCACFFPSVGQPHGRPAHRASLCSSRPPQQDRGPDRWLIRPRRKRSSSRLIVRAGKAGEFRHVLDKIKR